MNTELQAEQQMNTTILNYPGFQTLPKGVKQMLLISEAHFFEQPAPHHQQQNERPQEMGTYRNLKDLWRSPLIRVNIALEA